MCDKFVSFGQGRAKPLEQWFSNLSAQALALGNADVKAHPETRSGVRGQKYELLTGLPAALILIQATL